MKKIQSIGKSTGTNKTKLRTYKTREAISIAEKNGWVLARTKADHFYFKHPDNPKLLLISNKLNRMVWERCVNEFKLNLSK